MHLSLDVPTYLGVTEHGQLGVRARLDVVADIVTELLGAGLDRVQVDGVVDRGRVVEGNNLGVIDPVGHKVGDGANLANARVLVGAAGDNQVQTLGAFLLLGVGRAGRGREESNRSGAHLGYVIVRNAERRRGGGDEMTLFVM